MTKILKKKKLLNKRNFYPYKNIYREPLAGKKQVWLAHVFNARWRSCALARSVWQGRLTLCLQEIFYLIIHIYIFLWWWYGIVVMTILCCSRPRATSWKWWANKTVWGFIFCCLLFIFETLELWNSMEISILINDVSHLSHETSLASLMIHISLMKWNAQFSVWNLWTDCILICVVRSWSLPY